VEFGIIPLDGVQQFPDGDTGFQFLPNLASDSLLGSLPRLDFAARELPPVFPVAGPALGGEDAVLGVVDDGGGNGDVFHSLFVLVEDDQRADDAGTHPAQVRMKTMSTDPHPRSMTASGGKKMARRTRSMDIRR
jgi:hypothetical protein